MDAARTEEDGDRLLSGIADGLEEEPEQGMGFEAGREIEEEICVCCERSCSSPIGGVGEKKLDADAGGCGHAIVGLERAFVVCPRGRGCVLDERPLDPDQHAGSEIDESASAEGVEEEGRLIRRQGDGFGDPATHAVEGFLARKAGLTLDLQKIAEEMVPLGVHVEIACALLPAHSAETPDSPLVRLAVGREGEDGALDNAESASGWLAAWKGESGGLEVLIACLGGEGRQEQRVAGVFLERVGPAECGSAMNATGAEEKGREESEKGYG